ncbi:hypothetical protein AB5I41_14330 [Sphingomonas sp. MMS24-JH45]
MPVPGWRTSPRSTIPTITRCTTTPIPSTSACGTTTRCSTTASTISTPYRATTIAWRCCGTSRSSSTRSRRRLRRTSYPASSPSSS